MKSKRYKAIVSIYRRDIKTCIRKMKEFSSKFMWDDNDLEEYEMVRTRFKRCAKNFYNKESVSSEELRRFYDAFDVKSQGRMVKL